MPDEDSVVDWQARLAGKVRALENLGKFTRSEPPSETPKGKGEELQISGLEFPYSEEDLAQHRKELRLCTSNDVKADVACRG